MKTWLTLLLQAQEAKETCQGMTQDLAKDFKKTAAAATAASQQAFSDVDVRLKGKMQAIEVAEEAYRKQLQQLWSEYKVIHGELPAIRKVCF